MRSARPFLPSFMSLTTKRSVVRVRVGAYFALRGVPVRRGIYLGLLAPYSERLCLRSRTPAASSVPRMMWYFTDGRSLTRPPRTSTTECSWSCLLYTSDAADEEDSVDL